MRRRQIALALGGGSARGLAHLGVLKVLIQNDIPIDLIAGTSIGALIGAVYALGCPLDEVEKKALGIKWWDLTDFAISKMGFLEGRNLERMIKELTCEKAFKHLKKPLSIVCTDIENGQEVVLKSGSLHRSIRASCSMPGVFIPVRISGRLLVDGGLKSNVPTAVARSMGASYVIASDVGYCIKKGKVSNVFQVLFQSMQIVGNELNKHEAKTADTAIKVDLGDDIDQMAFHKAKQIITAGEKAAKGMISFLKKDLKEEGLM